MIATETGSPDCQCGTTGLTAEAEQPNNALLPLRGNGDTAIDAGFV
jgi:hypothetical protein